MAFRLVFTATLILLLSAGASHAEPISAIVTAIGAALKAGLTAAALLKGAFAVALNIGISLVQQARAKRAQRKQEPRGTTLSVQFGDTLPLSYLIGTRATAGRRYYAGVWGTAGKTPNAFATDCRVISSLPSNAGPQGLEEAWFGKTKGTILWNEPHPDGRGFPVQEFRSASGNDYLWVKYYDGSQTTADAFLLEKFGAVEGHPYKATMIGRGCQLAIFTCRVTEHFFPSGFPDALFVPKPMKLYDLRRDSTVGGSGPQRWDNPSTWESSNLLPVMMYNVARGIYYDGKWVHGGRNFAAHRLPASSWMAAINEADREMAGGRKQYRGGLEVFVDQEPLDTLEDMRIGCAGRLADLGGSVKLLVGSPAGAIYSFTDASVVVTSDQDFEPFPSITATHNTITADYPEPKERWAYKDAPEKSSAALLARDGGEVLPFAVRFDAVPFTGQVQSVMKAMIAEEQRWRIHNLPLSPDANGLEPNDVLSWTSEKQFYSTKRFIAVRVTRLTGGLVRVLMKEMDPNDYDPPSIIIDPVVGWIGRIDVPPQAMGGFQALPYTFRDANGVARRPGVEIRATPDEDDVAYVRIEVRLKADGSVIYRSDDLPYETPFAWVPPANFLPATVYEARGKFLPKTNRQTLWSAWQDVLTPDVRLGSEDLYLDQLAQEVYSELSQLQDWIWRDTSIRDLIEDRKALARGVAEQDLANFADKQQLRTELVSLGQALTASFTDVITVATSATSALAQRVSTLEVTYQGFPAASVINTTIAKVTTLEGNYSALAADMTVVQAGLSDKIGSSVFNSLASTVTQQGNTITLQGDIINQIDLELDGKASLTALNTLTGTVTQQGNTISSHGTLLNSLSADVGEVSADARLRFEVVNNSGGTGYSTIGLQARFGTAENFRSAGLFIKTPSDPGLPAEVIVNAQRFAVAAGNDENGVKIFAVDGSGVFMDSAYIRNLNVLKLVAGADTVFKVDGSGVYMDTAFIRSISTSKITFEDGSIQSSAIAPGAITEIAEARLGSGTFTGTRDCNVTITHGNRATIPGLRVKVEGYALYSTDEADIEPRPVGFSLVNGTDSATMISFTSYPPAVNQIIPLAYSRIFTPPVGRTQTTFRVRLQSLHGTAHDMTIIATAFLK